MAKRTCSVCGDTGKIVRGLCMRHYRMAWRQNQLPPLQPELAFGIHSLSNVDRDARLADCAICGPQVRIRVRGTQGGESGIRCRTADRKGQRETRLAAARRYHLRAKYGLADGDYDRMYAQQDGRCAICGTSCDKLNVDHDHATGDVRGLLCQHCNIALGWLRDDPERAAATALYLKRDVRLNTH
jgi:hypothetical protein